MFHSLLVHLGPLLKHYGALGLFGASIVEEVIAPIPSTLVVFTAGLLMTKGLHGWTAVSVLVFQVMLPAAAGMTIGSLFPYYLARIGEKVAIERFGKYLGINWKTIEKVQAWTKKSHSDEFLIFASRAIPGMPSLAVSIIAGLARIPVKEFLFFSFLGALPRTFILGAAGWWGGRQASGAVELLNMAEGNVLIIILAVLASGLLYLFLNQRKKSRTKPIQA